MPSVGDADEEPLVPVDGGWGIDDKFLAALEMFKDSDKAMLRRLAKKARRYPVKACEVFAMQGHSAVGLLVVMHGRLKVCIDDCQVDALCPGDYFGEAVLMGLASHFPASLSGLGEAEVILIGRDDLVEACTRFPREAAFFGCGVAPLSEPGSKQVDFQRADALALRTPILHDILLRACDVELPDVLDAGLMPPRVFFPGETIIEGEVGITSKSRRASEERHVVSSTDPMCCGHLELLGIRPAGHETIVAKTVCYAIVLYREVLMHALQGKHLCMSVGSVKDFFTRHYPDVSYVPPEVQLQGIEMLRALFQHADFVAFLARGVCCHAARLYVPGAQIIVEGEESDRCLYIVVQGQATIVKGGEKLGVLTKGDVFGVRTTFGMRPTHGATVQADMTTLLIYISEPELKRAFIAFPERLPDMMTIALKLSELRDSPATHVGKRNTIMSASLADLRKFAASYVVDSAKSSPYLGGISLAFIEALSEVSVDHVFLPGETLMEQGAEGDSMFIIVSGRAEVYTEIEEPDDEPVERNPTKSSGGDLGNIRRASRSCVVSPASFRRRFTRKVGLLPPGSISGELAMLGIAPARLATIEAATFCCAWEVRGCDALPIIERFPFMQDHFRGIIRKHLEHTTVGCMTNLGLLKHFSREVRMRMALYAERRVYFPGEVFCQEGKEGDELSIICKGDASVESGGHHIKTLIEGDYANSLVMLGVKKMYPYTVRAARTCYVLVVTRHAYHQVVEGSSGARDAAQKLKAAEVASHERRKHDRTGAVRFAAGPDGDASGVVPGRSGSTVPKDSSRQEASKDGTWDSFGNIFGGRQSPAEVIFNAWARYAAKRVVKSRVIRKKKKQLEAWTARSRDAAALNQRRLDEAKALAARSTFRTASPRRAMPSSPQSPRRLPKLHTPTRPDVFAAALSARAPPSFLPRHAEKLEQMSNVYLDDGKAWESLMPASPGVASPRRLGTYLR